MMKDSTSIEDFIYSPDTIDFVARRTETLEKFIEDNPDMFLTQPLAGRFILGYIKRENADYAIKTLGASSISSASYVLGLLDRQSLEASGIIQAQQQPYLSLHGNGVLIGFVDTGIDYTLDVFKYQDGTSKIQFIYDQTVRSGSNPEGFYLGTEYTNEQINEALKSKDPLSIVPEQDTVGHGTFLASVAAGNEVGDFIGAAPDSELVVVKVRDARPFYRERYLIPKDQENVFESSSVMVGIEYILRKARQLERPVVICIGLGTNQGGHDGFSIFEEYLTEISSLNAVCVCTAGGNESQARHHTQGKIPERGAQQDIDIKAGDNAGDIYVTIWNSIADRMSVSIRSPTGELVQRVPAITITSMEQKLILENSSVIVEYYFPLEVSGGQLTVVKIINATPGIWTITVHGDIILDGTYHSWLPLTGLISPNVEFLSAIPYYTIVVPSTALGTITCGAYNSTNDSLYIQSSWGPTRTPAMSPDLVAPGVNVGGYYPDGYGVMSGTSTAAAITAGASALLMQWGIVEKNEVSLSTYQIRAYLIRGCERSETLTYPNSQWGYGTLDLMGTFNLMREL